MSVQLSYWLKSVFAPKIIHGTIYLWLLKDECSIRNLSNYSELSQSQSLGMNSLKGEIDALCINACPSLTIHTALPAPFL